MSVSRKAKVRFTRQVKHDLHHVNAFQPQVLIDKATRFFLMKKTRGGGEGFLEAQQLEI